MILINDKKILLLNEKTRNQKTLLYTVSYVPIRSMTKTIADCDS